jgi:hypothetical protein
MLSFFSIQPRSSVRFAVTVIAWLIVGFGIHAAVFALVILRFGPPPAPSDGPRYEWRFEHAPDEWPEFGKGWETRNAAILVRAIGKVEGDTYYAQYMWRVETPLPSFARWAHIADDDRLPFTPPPDRLPATYWTGAVELPNWGKRLSVDPGRLIPLRPIWWGLCGNVCLYAIFGSLVFTCFKSLRRCCRRRGGRCQSCGYLLLVEQNRCPECGTYRAG